MSRILINEIDETSPELAPQEITDIVFVPGFSCAIIQEGGTAVNAGIPTLCRTVAEFEQKFGTEPALFSSNQSYPSQFAAVSHSTELNDYMFFAGDPDPSYIYAKELLTAGIPVVYERLNTYSYPTPSSTDPSVILYDVTVNDFYSKVSSKVFSNTYTLQNFQNDAFDYSNPGQIQVSIETAAYKERTASASTTNVFKYHWFNDYSVFKKNTQYSIGTILKETESDKDYSYYQVIAQINKNNDKSLSELQQENYVQKKNLDYTGGTNGFGPHWYLNGNEITYEQLQEYSISIQGSSILFEHTTQDHITYEIGSVIRSEETQQEQSTSILYYLVTQEFTSEEATIPTDKTILLFSGSAQNPDVVSIGSKITVISSLDECRLLDKDQYQIKYITTGGYPSFEYNTNIICNAMSSVASSRGDCIALFDHTDYAARDLLGQNSVFNSVQTAAFASKDSVYSAMFTPWGRYSLTASYGVNNDFSNGISLPASFAYLMSLANSITTNPSWYAVAGAARGKVPHLMSVNLNSPITNSIANTYQNDTRVSINPITYINPYGQCIWGNRTLLDNASKKGTTALSFLNIRNLVCDIKKQLYYACQSLMFDQNTDILWDNFLFLVTPTLDKMVTGYGLSNYQIIKQLPSDKSTIVAIVRVYPVYAVEAFDITLYLSDSEVTVE